MNWINEFQLFLFDFDGLLVNTEEIHYKAYQKMCADRGFNFDWTFSRYCKAAHYRAEALQEQLYEYLPELYKAEPEWKVLYSEKTAALIEMYNQGDVQLMPGAKQLLEKLSIANVPRAVVTHSADKLVNIIRNQHPILNTIPYWITRHDYSMPKPNPECYLKAIEMHAPKDGKVIGFEDSPRGIHALLGTRAQPVIVAKTDYPEIPQFESQGVIRLHSLEEINF